MPRPAGKRVARDELTPEHFRGWIDWAGRNRFGDGLQPDLLRPSPRPTTGTPWLMPIPASAAILGRSRQGVPERSAPRSARRSGRRASPTSGCPTGRRTRRSIAEGRGNGSGTRSTRSSPIRFPPEWNRDAVESKLFGLGSEAYVVGSHEFYLGYAITRETRCSASTAGHFHPTEVDLGQDFGGDDLARRDPPPREPGRPVG